MTPVANIIHLPTITKDQLANRDIIRANSTKFEDVIKIDLDKVVIRDGFNVRTDYGEIQELADSILENGQSEPGKVDALSDGTFALVEGHRRYRALHLIKQQTGDAPLFKATVNGSRTTEEQRIFLMFTTQQNKQLTPTEVSTLFQRLINLGYKTTDIAKKTGKTYQYVDQMLTFGTESPIIKDQVDKGAIAVATVIKLQKDIPVQNDRIEKVMQTIEAKPADKKKVTLNDVTGSTLNSWNECKNVLKSINSVDVAGSKIKIYDLMMDILDNKKDFSQIENFLLND